MLGDARLLLIDASKTARERTTGARELARADEHIFPSLRLAPVVGETGLENMLRQIDALTAGRTAPMPRALASPAARKPDPGPRAAVPPPQPAPRRRPKAFRRPELGRMAAGLSVGLAVVVVVLLPRHATFLASTLNWLPQTVSAAGARAANPHAIVAPPLVAAPSHAVAEKAPPPVLARAAAGPVSPVPDPPKASGAVIVAIPPLPKQVAVASEVVPPAAPAAEMNRAAAAMAALHPAAAPEKGPAGPSAPAPAPEQHEAVTGLPVPLLLERGNQLLASGDVVSARQFFERASKTGAAAAVRALGTTYDPIVLRQIGAVGIRADAIVAAAWYRRAARAGDAEAADRLARLQRVASAPDADAPKTPGTP